MLPGYQNLRGFKFISVQLSRMELMKLRKLRCGGGIREAPAQTLAEESGPS